MITAEEWYKQKKIDYKLYFNEEWSFLPWDNSAVYETLMRSAIEKQFFGITSFDEDVLIANSIIIRDLVQRRKQ